MLVQRKSKGGRIAIGNVSVKKSLNKLKGAGKVIAKPKS